MFVEGGVALRDQEKKAYQKIARTTLITPIAVKANAMKARIPITIRLVFLSVTWGVREARVYFAGSIATIVVLLTTHSRLPGR